MLGPAQRPESWAIVRRRLTALVAGAAAIAWIVGALAVVAVADIDRGENRSELVWLALVGGAALGTCAAFALRQQPVLATVAFMVASLLFAVWLQVADSEPWELYWIGLACAGAVTAGEGLAVRGFRLAAALSLAIAVALLVAWLSMV